MKNLLSFFLISIFLAPFITAQESNEDLAKTAQNPIANMISIPFLNSTNFGLGPMATGREIY